MAAVTYQGDPVVIGGFVPGAELTSKQSDRVYVLHDDQWELLPPLNRARAAAAAAVVGNKIVVVGGQADGKLVRETEVFDGQRWTVAADIPTPREHLGAASDGRYLYAVGGRNLSADKNSGGAGTLRPGQRQLDEAEEHAEGDRQRRRRVRRRERGGGRRRELDERLGRRPGLRGPAARLVAAAGAPGGPPRRVGHGAEHALRQR